MNELEIINDRLKNGDTGTSSKTMLGLYIDIEFTNDNGGPYDNSDFGRCRKLVKLIPRIKEIFPKLREIGQRRPNVLDNRELFGKLYEEQIAGQRDGVELYILMKN